MLKKTIISLVIGTTLVGTLASNVSGYAASKKVGHSSSENVNLTVPSTTSSTSEVIASNETSEKVTMAPVSELFSQFADSTYGIRADNLAYGVGLENAFNAVSVDTTMIIFKLNLETVGVLGTQAKAALQLRDLVSGAIIAPASISEDGVVTFDTKGFLQVSDQRDSSNRYQVEFNLTGSSAQALGLFTFPVYD